MTFYDTNKTKDPEEAEKKAQRQEDIILQKFKNCPTYGHSPEMIHRICCKNAPLTSVRRAITNLTKAGYLEKMQTTVLGQYDKKIHLWRLKKQERSLFDE